MELVSRRRAAELAGVSERTITRWADSGYLTKYLSGRGSVRFSKEQAGSLYEGPPAPAPVPAKESQEVQAPRPRW